MFLNHDVHFLAAKGYKTITGARKAAMRATSVMPVKPTYIMVTRYFDDRTDYVNVAIFDIDNTHLVRHLAENNFYCISAKSIPGSSRP